MPAPSAEAFTSSARGCAIDDVARHALLEQQLARLDHRLAMEARAHLPVLQGVRDGDDGHALVMRHEVAHDRDVLRLRAVAKRVKSSAS